MLIVVLPVFVLTAAFLWRYRAGNTASRYTPDWGFSWPLDITIWSIPAVIVITLAYFVWRDTHRFDPYRALAATQPPLRIQAVALPWKWLFIYPDQHIASINRLVFPVGRPVALMITSDTVMQAFDVPALAGQIFAMAGMQTQLHLLADRSGTFFGKDTQFDGYGFPNDEFQAVAVAPAAFDHFVSAAAHSSTPLDAATYAAIRKPSQANPPQLFSNADPGLFASTIAKYRAKVADDHPQGLDSRDP